MSEEGPSVESVGEALERGTRYLDRRGIEGPARNARFLLAHALDLEPQLLAGRLDLALGSEAARSFARLLCARGSRRPLQYLLGRWEFWGLEVEVGPAALIPRPETETLVEVALKELGPGPAIIADVGTGSGALALALAHERPVFRIIAIDRSPEALALAGRNARSLGLDARIEFRTGDLLAPVLEREGPGGLAAVVSNPPYVSEAEYPGLSPELGFEPREALVAGTSGYECYQRLIPEASRALAPGGLLALELGFGQAGRVSELLADNGAFSPPTLVADLAGIPRVLFARIKGPQAAER